MLRVVGIRWCSSTYFGSLGTLKCTLWFYPRSVSSLRSFLHSVASARLVIILWFTTCSIALLSFLVSAPHVYHWDAGICRTVFLRIAPCWLRCRPVWKSIQLGGDDVARSFDVETPMLFAIAFIVLFTNWWAIGTYARYRASLISISRYLLCGGSLPLCFGDGCSVLHHGCGLILAAGGSRYVRPQNSSLWHFWTSVISVNVLFFLCTFRFSAACLAESPTTRFSLLTLTKSFRLVASPWFITLIFLWLAIKCVRRRRAQKSFKQSSWDRAGRPWSGLYQAQRLITPFIISPKNWLRGRSMWARTKTTNKTAITSHYLNARQRNWRATWCWVWLACLALVSLWFLLRRRDVWSLGNQRKN